MISNVFWVLLTPHPTKSDFVQFQLMPVFYVVRCRPSFMDVPLLYSAQLSKFHLKFNAIARCYENFFLIEKEAMALD